MKAEFSQPSEWRQALLGSLLESVRLRSTVYFHPEYRAPWGVAMHRKVVSALGHAVREESIAAFHLLTSGECWLQVKGLTEPMRITAPDLVVFPRGHEHSLRDSPATPVVDFFDLAKEHHFERCLQAGGNGPVTTMICGSLHFEHGPIEPLLAILPPLIHVKGTENRRAWLSVMAQHILEELKSAQPGFDSLVTRLGDILFIRAVRSYFEDNLSSADSGWLAAIRDPQIGQALALIHERPHERWNVASLARRTGLSRSAFAEKFARLVGEPPLHYLTRIRLHAAAIRLRESEAKLSAIAAASGYDSTAAFNKVFKRHMSVTPGEYRRAPRLLPGGGKGVSSG